jgi:hypothetical protein
MSLDTELRLGTDDMFLRLVIWPIPTAMS